MRRLVTTSDPLNASNLARDPAFQLESKTIRIRTMSEYETDMIRLIQQIAEDIRWLRHRAEETDRIKK